MFKSWWVVGTTNLQIKKNKLFKSIIEITFLLQGHDIFGFDLEVLLHRIEQNKIPHWSRLGRLKRASIPKFAGGRGKGGAGANASCGRLVCDVMISAKEVIRCRSYDLAELVTQVLKDTRQEVDLDQLRNYYK